MPSSATIRTDLAQTFRKSLRRGCESCQLREGPILLAHSGGADSMALMLGLLELREELKITLIAAHLDHQLRGEESRQDARWLRQECGRLDIPILIFEEDVAALARDHRKGIEETARKARYRFLDRAAEGHQCSRIAVAHSADDQVETILHHLLRGTGLAGLRGMPWRRRLKSGVVLARPCLEISRAEVEAYLGAVGQEFRTDSSNTDLTLTRVRVRRILLPALERDFNPRVRQALLRLGRQTQEVQTTIELAARAVLERALIEKTETVCRLNCDEFVSQPDHLVRECLVLLWKQLDWPRQRMGYAEWNRAVRLVRLGGRHTLPGNIDACRRGKLLILTRS